MLSPRTPKLTSANKKGNTMFDTLPIEAWNTRYGVSIRTVTRDDAGRFINNKSAKQTIKIQEKANSK